MFKNSNIIEINELNGYKYLIPKIHNQQIKNIFFYITVAKILVTDLLRSKS